MTSIEQTGATVATKSVEFSYLKDGRLDTLVRSNGVTSDFNYNDRGQLTSLVHAGVGAGSISHAYTYQGPRVATYTNVHGTVTYGYDHLDQLKSANWPGSANDENYSYDDAGNRTLDGALSYTVGVNNRLLSDGTYTYQYDAEGNLTQRYVDVDASGTLNSGDTDVTLYDYDHKNRLAKVTHKPSFSAANDQVISYLYDHFDRRIGRDLDADGNGTIDRRERWVNDGSEAILEFLDPDGDGPAAMALSKRFLNGPAVDQILAQEDLSKSISAADRVLWHLSDSQGTVRDLVDNTGDLVEHYRYDAFGELIEIRDGANNVVTTQPKTNLLYNGMWRDPETGDLHARHRVYDPATGRWKQEDPQPDDVNLYRYVGNSPTGYIDPDGLARLPVNGGHWDGAPGNSNWIPDQSIPLPDGGVAESVPFRDGYPDFSGWCEAEVEISMTGHNRRDKRLARDQMRILTGDPKWKPRDGYLWHHDALTGKMQLVPSGLNDIVHEGAACLVRQGLPARINLRPSSGLKCVTGTVDIIGTIENVRDGVDRIRGGVTWGPYTFKDRGGTYVYEQMGEGFAYRGTDKVYICGPREGEREMTFNAWARLKVLWKSLFDRPATGRPVFGEDWQ
ncbi:MAG: HNH endonuclease [Pirellulales bacterium]|nr:HNH endonuclease [Pirellulales bacterium]